MSEFTDSLPDDFRFEIEVVAEVQESYELDKHDLKQAAADGVNIFSEYALVRWVNKRRWLDQWSEREVTHLEPQGTYCYEGREMVCNGLDEYEPEAADGNS